jgi:hypothetical protein
MLASPAHGAKLKGPDGALVAEPVRSPPRRAPMNPVSVVLEALEPLVRSGVVMNVQDKERIGPLPEVIVTVGMARSIGLGARTRVLEL